MPLFSIKFVCALGFIFKITLQCLLIYESVLYMFGTIIIPFSYALRNYFKYAEHVLLSAYILELLLNVVALAGTVVANFSLLFPWFCYQHVKVPFLLVHLLCVNVYVCTYVQDFNYILNGLLYVLCLLSILLSEWFILNVCRSMLSQEVNLPNIYKICCLTYKYRIKEPKAENASSNYFINKDTYYA